MSGDDKRIETDGVISGRRPWLGLVALGGLTIASGAMLCGAKIIQYVATVAFFAAGFFINHARYKRKGRVVVDERGLSLDGKLIVPRDAIRARSLSETTNGVPRVSIAYRRGKLHLSLDLALADPSIARAIVRALPSPTDNIFYRARLVGVRSPATFWKTMAVSIPLSLGILWLAQRYPLHPLTWFVTILTVFCGPLLASMYSWITIGADGIHLRYVASQRFISFRDIDTIASDEHGLALSLRSKKKAQIAISVPEQRLQVESKIREGLARFVLGAIPHAVPDEIERRDRSTREWITSLRSIGSSSKTKYRVAATSPDDLSRVLADQNADAAARAAAAVALDAIDHGAAERIRAVASHTANPKLRVALERIANHADDAEIEASLDELSERRRA